MGDLDPGAQPLLMTPPSPGAAQAAEAVAARRRRRRRTDRDSVLRAAAARSPRVAQKLEELWDGGREEAIRRAERYRAIAEVSQDPLGPELDEELARVEALQIASTLRCTVAQAQSAIRKAHRIDALLPDSLALMATGAFPLPWFEKLVERTGDLADPAVLEVDRSMAASDLDVTYEAFSRRLGHLVTLATSRSETPAHARPEARRRVVLDPARPDGTGCLRIIGPIPELLTLSRRLDAAAHVVKNGQLQALEEGQPLPCDPGGRIAETGEVPTISAIRYELLLAAALDTGTVTASPERFRLTITVPAMTLLGESDAPGMLDGVIPVPASMARDLAAREKTWYRVLTDPSSGRFLPLPAKRYTATPEMLEHLRLRHPTCVVPGCGRPVSFLSECDHIEEYDQQDPDRGGRTSIENTHLLCREHHRLKTAGLLDPVRDDQAGRTWWEVAEQVMAWQEDARDLATEQVVAEMTAAWESHRAAEEARKESARRLWDLEQQGLSPGDLVRGPDGAPDWRIARDGRILPPDEPPPF